MHLQQLSLANFRSYRQLELELPYPIVLLQGNNGQGKSNLLEAIYFLATTRSLRAGSDRELINWEALEEPIPFARVAGTVKKTRGDLRVEIAIRADRPERAGAALGESGGTPLGLSKRIKINGVAKRALDLLGQINVVMFSPQDLELITGSPSIRRRYLDIVNCQVDRRYCRALQQYNRVLHQRNHLLKQIRDGKQPIETLEFWSEELVKSGAYLLWRRLETVAALNGWLESYFHRLTRTGKRLKMAYRSTVDEAVGGAETRGHRDGPHPLPLPHRERGDELALTEGERERARGHVHGGEGELAQDSGLRTQDPQLTETAELFREALRRYRRRETLQGVSLLGPHRDDLVFRADGIDMNVYGSRGEQRAVALALKLSEVEFLQEATGEWPLLLLDDVMSELDPSRRLLLLETIGSSGQTLITTTELESFSPKFLASAALFEIHQGTVVLTRKPA
ncbi:MAG: DNA replication/repair protein RecF [Chloroflexota bacterium]